MQRSSTNSLDAGGYVRKPPNVFLYIMCNIVVKSLEGLSLPSAGRDKPDVGHNRNIHRIRRVKHY